VIAVTQLPNRRPAPVAGSLIAISARYRPGAHDLDHQTHSA
jgi:hypothetical protein